MKQLNDLTIKEFQSYTELIADANPDVYGIFELFGLDADNMDFATFQTKLAEIQKMQLSTSGTKKIYVIGGKRFKACLNPLKLKAGQFIDFQNYISTGAKLECILSVFLIPQYKSWAFGKHKTYKYNDGYDIFQLQRYLYENMHIGEASELSSFFLNWSTILLKTMKEYSEKKLWKMKSKRLQKQKTDLLG